MRILVDTNIIIDALTGREPFREAAEQVFLIAANRAEDMYITAKYSLQGTTQGNGLTGGLPPVRFSM